MDEQNTNTNTNMDRGDWSSKAGSAASIDLSVAPETHPDRTAPAAATAAPWLVWAMPRLVSICFFAVLFVWIYQAEGGLGTAFLNLFGLHALLMSLFVVVFTQESLLVLAAPLMRACARSSNARVAALARFTRSQRFHVVLHLLGMLCCIGGLCAIVYYKQLSPRPISYPFCMILHTMYSPHSWCAVCFLGLWGLQFAGGLYIHAYNPASYAKLQKYHQFLGKAVYAVGLATCALGFQDMQASDLAGSVPPWVDTANFTQDQVDDMGYYPQSTLAQLSCAGVMLLIFQGLATFFTYL